MSSAMASASRTAPPPKLIDLVDGTVYEIPENQIEDCGTYRKLLHLPLRDYPLLLTFGDFR